MHDVIYPPQIIPNRTWTPGRTRHDPILGLLEQPRYLPAELDSRVDPSTVWMKVAPSTGKLGSEGIANTQEKSCSSFRVHVHPA